MSNLPIISQTMLDVLLERVCIPINYLSTKIDSNTPLWDEPVMMCQQIEKNRFAVESVIQNAKKRNGVFHATNTIRYYHAILCRVYIILYYLHPNDETYQTIVFPSLKKNMGIYNENYLTKINKEIDLIHEQEELIKKLQAEKKKDVKPVFAYVSHSGHEQDHLAIEYNEEQLFRNMSGVIRNLADKYNTRQDEANVWYNAKQVVHTLRDINRPELLINRAASALVYGQLNNGYNGSQIVLICAYVMIRSSKNNDHFSAFIQEMESLADADTDLHVIKNSIRAIGNWITKSLPFENSEYIGEETTKAENYTIADIERITRQFEEDKAVMKRENAEVMKENEQLKNQIELLQQQIEEERSSEDINWHDKVRLDLLLRLMKKDGADLDKHGNKTKAAEVMRSVTSLPLQTCKNYCSDSNLNTKEHEDEILKLNSKLQALGMEIRL
jgi:hypothetical protein